MPYNADSWRVLLIEFNLSYKLLRLARVETNVDSKQRKARRSLKGVFKEQGCWGLPQRLLTADGCSGSFKGKGFSKGVHTQK